MAHLSLLYKLDLYVNFRLLNGMYRIIRNYIAASQTATFAFFSDKSAQRGRYNDSDILRIK